MKRRKEAEYVSASGRGNAGDFRSRLRVAAAGYVAVAAFCVAAGVALLLGSPVGMSAWVGGLFAAPVVVALVGEHVVGVKGFGIEISLENVTLKVENIAPDASGVIAHSEGADSVMQARTWEPEESAEYVPKADPFAALITDRSQLARINLRDGNYWSSTRIFLVAAMAQDLTDVQALVFVQGGDAQTFVGIATPRAVREHLAKVFPTYEKAYRRARIAAPCDDRGDLVYHPVIEATRMLEFAWRSELYEAFERPESEVERFVSTAEIVEWLQGDLDTRSFADGPLTPLKQFRILHHERRYAVLTDERGRLERVLGREELAVSLSVGYLEHRLSGS